MDVDRYLARIGVEAPIEPTLTNLERLQRSHLTNVPFENLHVFYRRGVKTTNDWTIPKIVDEGRGGWCFELNGAFATLLAEIGYEVTRMSATVLNGNRAPMPTHATIQVSLDIPYLVDVGFGDSFIRPLPLDSTGPHDGGTGEYTFIFEGDETTLVAADENGDRVDQYRFDRSPRSSSDFDDASVYLQTEPGLNWTTSRFATRLLNGGPDRVTLLEDRIKFRHDGKWTERPVDQRDWPDVLQRWFNMSP